MHLNQEISALLTLLANPTLPEVDLSLARIEALLAALGNPQRKLPPVIHLAGTNGKGSTQAFLRAIYAAAGYRVHAYTSPHLVRFNERITLAGREISDGELLPLLQQVVEMARQIPVTFFEATTAVAFLAFANTPADVVLLETGLGGRLDATNTIANPALTIITPIDYDHMEFLGGSIEAIAAEKAGILKAQVPCVVGVQQPEAYAAIARAAHQWQVPHIAYGRDWTVAPTREGMTVTYGQSRLLLPPPALIGAHQYYNAALAVVAALSCPALPIEKEALAAGIATAEWPARLQRLTHGPLVEAWGTRGYVFLDGGHNQSAAHALLVWMEQQTLPITLVAGMMQRKDAMAFFAPLAKQIARLVAVPIHGEDAYAPGALAAAAEQAGVQHVAACASLAEAPAALAGDAVGHLLICGSLFLAGEVLKNHG